MFLSIIQNERENKENNLRKFMGKIRWNMDFLEYQIRVKIYGQEPKKVLRFLRKLVDICHRLDIE